jgi:hypothetical protein
MVRGQLIDTSGFVSIVAPTRALLGTQALVGGGGVPLVATRRGPPAIMTKMSNINVLEFQQKKSTHHTQHVYEGQCDPIHF